MEFRYDDEGEQQREFASNSVSILRHWHLIQAKASQTKSRIRTKQQKSIKIPTQYT